MNRYKNKKPIIICENIRSEYNVGNIIRTADALGFDVILSGYTPTPQNNPAIKKTALGAEIFVSIHHFWNTKDTLNYLIENNYYIIAAEITKKSDSLSTIDKIDIENHTNIALIVGNEVTGVLQETLEYCHRIIHIPMIGSKESLNVGQAAAIMMWHLMYITKTKK